MNWLGRFLKVAWRRMLLGLTSMSSCLAEGRPSHWGNKNIWSQPAISDWFTKASKWILCTFRHLWGICTTLFFFFMEHIIAICPLWCLIQILRRETFDLILQSFAATRSTGGGSLVVRGCLETLQNCPAIEDLEFHSANPNIFRRKLNSNRTFQIYVL